MGKDETKKLARLATFLRIYGVLSLIIFGSLFVGFLLQTPLLAEGGCLNWTIWNGIQCGSGHVCVVPELHDVGQPFPWLTHGSATRGVTTLPAVGIGAKQEGILCPSVTQMLEQKLNA